MSQQHWAARGASTIRRYSSYLMVVIAVIGVGFVYQRGFYAFLGPVVGGAVGSILNLVLGDERTVFKQKPIDPRIAATGVSLYVVAIIAMYRSVLYVRPITHYVLFGSMAAFIAYQIWGGQSRWQVLTQILVLAFFTYWSTQFSYPAGVISPDGGFIGTAETIARTGVVPSDVAYQKTPAHMIYVAGGLLVTELSGVIGYQLLSICALLITIILVGSIDRAIPRLTPRVALFSALVFAVMSFTLRRGMFPDKTNFFKPLLMVLVLVAFFVTYRSTERRRFLIIAVMCLPTLVFGHTYSAGAALLVIGSIWGYHRITGVSDGLDYTSAVSQQRITRLVITQLVLIMFLGVAGYSLAGGNGFVGRLTAILVSLLDLFAPAAEAGGTTGGRYSTLSLTVLLFSTAAQAILFVLSVIGIGSAIRRRDWSFDVIIAWIAVGIGLLGFSAIGNAVDIPTPRIYLLIGMFGLNVMAAIGIFRLASSVSLQLQRPVIVTVTFIFVVFSLASPVGSVALSPVSDEVPSKWRYHTAPDHEEHSWADEFGTESLLETRSVGTEIPLRRTGAKTVGIQYNNISEGTPYEYRDLARERGVKFGGRSERLGGNQILFLTMTGGETSDSMIYHNGKSTVFVHHNSTDRAQSR